MTPNGATKVACVIGDPIAHSLSPALHNATFAACDLDWVYVAFRVEAGGARGALDAMRTLGLGGMSVTMPHKADVADACDELTADARTLRSVNCVVPRPDGTLLGDSTDGEGFVRSLRDTGVDPAGARVLLLGAGGAARAVALALERSGAHVRCTARRRDAAADAVAALQSGTTLAWGQHDDALADTDIVVNATPMGMGDDTQLVVDAAALRANHVVADLVYHPLDTVLLRAARGAGAHAIDGLGMLVHQAAIAFEAWTGAMAPVSAMRAAALTRVQSG